MDTRNKNKEWAEKIKKGLLSETKKDFKPIKRKKKKLDESVLGTLPSKKMFKFNPETGRYDKPETWNEEAINESGYKSNITSKWRTVKDIETDLVNFIDDSYQAAGDDMIELLAKVFKNIHEYIQAGKYED